MGKFIEFLAGIGASKTFVGHLGRRRNWTGELVKITLTPKEAQLVEESFDRRKGDSCSIDTAARLFPDKVKRHR